MPTRARTDEGVHHEAERPEAGADRAEDGEALDLLASSSSGSRPVVDLLARPAPASTRAAR